jgi:hypothetical protein
MELLGIVFILMIAMAAYVFAPKYRQLLFWFAMAIILTPILFGLGTYGLGLILLSPYLFALLAAIAAPNVRAVRKVFRPQSSLSKLPTATA